MRVLIGILGYTKLLGVVLSTDLKWKKNLEYISGRVRKKLWTLRRTKEVGGTTDDLLMVYKLQIRCLTELACPAWNGALTAQNIKELEKLQKISLRLILGTSYVSYENSLEVLNLPTLADHRKQICLSFAKKTASTPKFTPWFMKNPRKTRNGNLYLLPRARTQAYANSPRFFITKLLNDAK